MKLKINIIVFLFSAVTNCLVSTIGYAQCPASPPCTYTAVSGSNYTVNTGEVLCINSPTNYSAGTITLNGGSVYVESGATLGRDISPSAPSTITVCGTLSGTRRFNNNATVDYYGSSNVNFDYTNGGTLNNYSSSVTISLTNISASTPACAFTNYGTGVNVSISNWNNVLNLNNTVGASMTVTSSPTVYSNSTITNSGTMNWSPQLTMNSGSVFTNNAGATFNATSSSQSNFNGATFNNSGTANFTTGPVFQATSTINNNAGGTINSLSGRLDITGGTTLNNSGGITAACSTGGCTSIIIQNSSIVNNTATGFITATSGLFDTNGSPTINNDGALTVFDIRINSGTVLNLLDRSIFTVTNRITTLDTPIGNPSGCAFIDLTTAVFNGCSNQNLTNSPNVNICGQVPYCDGTTRSITNATNAGPIVITTSAAHGLANGAKIVITGVVGNTAANQYYTVANVTANTFELVGSTGNGAYVSGGVVHFNVKLGSANYLGNTGCTNPCPPLKVEWLLFSATPRDNNVLLSWTTASEKNSNYFIFEKSVDGINFVSIGIVNAVGNSNSSTTYQFIDTEINAGTVYYRIQEVDLSGEISFSIIEKVTRTTTKENWVIFPDPSEGNELYIQLKEYEALLGESIQILIFDAVGKVVYESEFRIQDNSPVKLNLYSPISSGIYFVQISTGTNKNVKKIMVR